MAPEMVIAPCVRSESGATVPVCDDCVAEGAEHLKDICPAEGCCAWCSSQVSRKPAQVELSI